MSTHQQLHLEDAQKRLSLFKKHLDLLAHCTGQSKNIDANEVLSAVSELQSLVEWAAQQPELGAESAVLLVKLQELHQIRENLEKSPTETGESSTPELKDSEISINLDKSENDSKDIDYNSDTITPNLDDNNGDNMLEDDSFNISGDKESLCDFSASTEDPNLANAESPESIEDANVDIIPNDEKTEETDVLDDNDYPRPKNVPRGLLENEDQESQPENLEVQEFYHSPEAEIPESVSRNTDLKSPNLYRSEVIIIETDEDNKSTEWTNDIKSSNDPLDICMYAIRNLYESLRVKENELLKLSTMQNDQKHIEALQAVIIDFHKDKTNLNCELENTKRENTILKEQVLELEEAENDARLEAQNLGQKLVFLQEKDSHSQAELTQLKQTLKKNADALEEKEAAEKELRSQIKYMETLVQKYEDQIKVLEAKDIASSKQIQEIEEKLLKESENQKRKVGCNKGTQTYQPSQTKIDSNGDVQIDKDSGDRRLSADQSVQVPDQSDGVKNEIISEDMSSSVCSSSGADMNSKDPSIINMDCISQKVLLNRLHKLIDEDVSLQQQLHNVDQINLALWKKLQNLDSHIGECKRQNINETDPVAADTEIKGYSEVITDIQELAQDTITTNENIPVDNSNCPDQSENIQERLAKLEEINASFEKELKTRETICKEKEKKHGEWMKTEKRLLDDLKRLADEKDCSMDQIIKLKKNKEELEKNIVRQEAELKSLKEINETEIAKIKEEEESMTHPLNLEVNLLLIKEKEILKMIANSKIEKSKNQDKSELQKLKGRYIELQLELSHYREQISKIEEQFKIRLDHCAAKYSLEETKCNSELENLLREKMKCDKMICNLEIKLRDSHNALEKQDKYLKQVTEHYKKNLEETEEEHRSIESELKTQLHEIEEGTVVATTAIMEERKRVEKDLQENVTDLRTKEEVYKARINELEQNVIHLHEELHKMSAESEPKREDAQLEENAERKISDKVNETPQKKNLPESKNSPSESLFQTLLPNIKLVQSQENVVEEPAAKKKDYVDHITAVNILAQEEQTEENVDELRAQVRELQNQLDKISGEESQMPPVQSTKPMQQKKQYLGSQKLEDLDYAEIDEIEAWRKPEQSPSSNDISSKFQGVYGDKYLTGFKENFKNERKPIQKPVEENDYDEVLPRPTNFHVVQQVGSDTLLVGWNYVNPSILDGFEVYLGNQVHERIYIPDRTKALISGLNLKKPIHLSICALSRYGQMSEPAVLDLSLPHELNAKYFELQDEDDEYRDFEDPMNRQKRPYSMEW